MLPNVSETFVDSFTRDCEHGSTLRTPKRDRAGRLPVKRRNRMHGAMKSEIPSYVENVTAVLFLCIRAVAEHRIKPKEGNFLSNCADDFTKLGRLRLKHFKKLRRESAPITGGVPELRPLRDLIERGDYTTAMQEAKRIRALMAPILEQAKENLQLPVERLAESGALKKLKR
jgi:hypothetical protein